MDLERIRVSLREELKEGRYRHSLGVEEVACDLAFIHGADPDKASLAGLIHDCAKNLTDEKLIEECEVYQLPISDIERECPFLLHGKVGAVYGQIKYGVEDEEVLKAIEYHTTGRPAMTLLEKIIFVADYIEPYRRPLPRIDIIRETAYTDLNHGVFMVLENVLSYLKNTGAKIDMLTVETYNYYKEILQLPSDRMSIGQCSGNIVSEVI